MTCDVVVPTLGRSSLEALLAALTGFPGRVIVVHDGSGPVPHRPGVEVIQGPRRGPAAARNAGWRAARGDWVVFLDDDVVPDARWVEQLLEELGAAPPNVAGIQGRIVVPLPSHRAPTDWERNVAGLERARWATADMAYRRDVLARLGGFDERFRRAYREDADLALRVERAGYRLERGVRTVSHPVGPAGRWVSLRLQAGNADDTLMRRLHGDWQRADEPRGRFRRHLAVTAVGAGALAALALGRSRAAQALGAAWLAGSVEFAWMRIAPGPRTADEVSTMVVTSALIPPLAVAYRLAGTIRSRVPRPLARPPAAVLLDRDGTLVEDVPYNGDPARVIPIAGAREALDRLRAAGVPLAVISNQSGVARGLLTAEQVEAVNRRVEELLGPLGPWAVCLHGPDDGCECRKPRAGLVRQAAEALGVDPSRCAVVGDIGSDVEAARSAGARAVLVPTPRTRREEIEAAPEVAPDLDAAVDILLGRPQ